MQPAKPMRGVRLAAAHGLLAQAALLQLRACGSKVSFIDGKERSSTSSTGESQAGDAASIRGQRGQSEEGIAADRQEEELERSPERIPGNRPAHVHAEVLNTLVPGYVHDVEDIRASVGSRSDEASPQ